jgi:predicted nucleic-acid-binding protein
MKRVYVDANVILRFLTSDPPDLAQQAYVLFSAAERREIVLVLDEIVMAELVWVLDSFYKHPAEEIARTLGELLAQESVAADDKDLLAEALAMFANHHVDFADALVAARMRRREATEVVSFDAHFDRLPGIVRLTPKAAVEAATRFAAEDSEAGR